MKRNIISIAALALIAIAGHAAAADKTAPETRMPPVTRKAPVLLQTPSTVSTPTTTPAGGVTTAPGLPQEVIAKLVSAKLSLSEARTLEQITLKMDGINLGVGHDCHGVVTWGDGQKFEGKVGENGMWRSLNKLYDKPGNYTVTVTSQSFVNSVCTSNAPFTMTVKINPPAALPPSTLTTLTVAPHSQPKARIIHASWSGAGNAKAACTYIMNFGDGASKIMSAGPQQTSASEYHLYAPGTYSAILTPSNADYDSCSLGPNAGPKTFTVQ